MAPRSRLRRPSRLYRLAVGIGSCALLGGLALFVFSMAGMAAAAEGNTAAHHANLGVLMSFGFMVATALMLRLGLHSEDWRLMPWLPITRGDVAQRLLWQRVPFLVGPVAAVLAVPVWPAGLVPTLYLQVLLLATLFTLIALRETFLDTWWWGLFLFPFRWPVRKLLGDMKWQDVSGVLGVLAGPMLGGVIIVGIAVMGKPAIAMLGGGQVAAFGFGPVTIPAFLVLSPFSLPFLMHHPATTPGPMVSWGFTVGLVALNGLALYEVYRAFGVWCSFLPLQAMAIEPLSREALVAYDAQATLYDRIEAAGTEWNDDEAWEDEEAEWEDDAEGWEDEQASEAQGFNAPDNAPAPATMQAAEVAPLPPSPEPDRTRPHGRPSLPTPDVLPTPTTGAPLLSILFSANISGSLGLGGLGVLMLVAGGARHLVGLPMEAYRALAVLAVLMAVVARNWALIEHFHSQLPRGAALPLSWRGVPFDLAVRSLWRDWWCVLPALVFLGVLLGSSPVQLGLVAAMIIEAQMLAYAILRLREEAAGGRRWPIGLIKVALGVPLIFYLLTAIIVFIDNFENAPVEIQGSYWLACLLGYQTYAFLVTLLALWISTLRRDATILGTGR